MIDNFKIADKWKSEGYTYKRLFCFNASDPRSVCEVGIKTPLVNKSSLLTPDTFEIPPCRLFEDMDELSLEYSFISEWDKEHHNLCISDIENNEVTLSRNGWKITSHEFTKGKKRPTYNYSINIVDPTGVGVLVNGRISFHNPFDSKTQIFTMALLIILDDYSQHTSLLSFYSKYIKPILGDDSICGQGVIVGNLFFTSGHLVDFGRELYIICDDQKVFLKEENLEVFSVINIENDIDIAETNDIAVFELPNIYSPLKCSSLTNTKSIVGYTYRNQVNDTDSIFEYTELKQLIPYNGIVTSVHGNFIYATTKMTLREGDSGSPIFDGNKVVGILCGDIEGKTMSNDCLFQVVREFYSKISSYNYKLYQPRIFLHPQHNEQILFIMD